MAKSTIIITDKNFKITIPYELRLAENLNVGDIIEIDVIKYKGVKDEINDIRETVKNLTKSLIKQNKYKL